MILSFLWDYGIAMEKKLKMKRILFTATVILAILTFASQLSGKMSKQILVSGGGRTYLMDPSGKITWEQKKCGNIRRATKHGDWIYYSNSNIYCVNTKTGEEKLVEDKSLCHRLHNI
jgi:hypothetical protein